MIKREFGIFLIVGSLTVLVDFAVYRGLLWLDITSIDLAKGVSFLAGTIFAYFANRFWTFGHQSIAAGSVGRIHRWSRHDGTLLVARDLPRNKGAYLDGASVLLLPLDSLGHDGFDIVALDVESGESRVVVHVDRDAERFALGNDPKHWAAFGRRGTQPILTIWAGKGLLGEDRKRLIQY